MGPTAALSSVWVHVGLTSTTTGGLVGHARLHARLDVMMRYPAMTATLAVKRALEVG
jgi:hypothetical protein